jgi:hypothetical protein
MGHGKALAWARLMLTDSSFDVEYATITIMAIRVCRPAETALDHRILVRALETADTIRSIFD